MLPAHPGYRLVIFDFDGTLADTFDWFVSILDGVADRYRFRRAQPEDRDELRRMTAREILARLEVRRWKVPLIARHMRALKSASLDQFSLFPGIAEMLRGLSEAGITLAIVSSDTEANIRACLGPEIAGLIDMFDCGASLFGKRAHIARVVRRTGIAANATLYVGDELRDGEAAHGAGVDFGAVAWGYCDVEALRRREPDHVFTQVDEIATACIGWPISLQAGGAPRPVAR